MAFFGTPNPDFFTGDETDELIRGAEGNDDLNGAGGNDTLDGETGVDVLRGGNGDDTYLFRLGQGGRGPFAIETIDEAFTTGSDILRLIDYTADSLRVESRQVDGINYLYVSATNDPNFETGIYLEHNPGTGQDFWDHVEGWELDGGTIYSSLQPFDFILPDNSGRIEGTRGNDLIRTEPGDGQGDVTFYGHGGNDTLLAGTESGQLYGGEGHDSLVGGSADIGNILVGGRGNDTLDSGFARANMDGGEGDDFFIIRRDNSFVSEDNGDGTDRAITFVDYDLRTSEVEVLILGGVDNISGRASSHGTFISGNVGANVLTGQNENDRLEGGAGNDTLDGFGGNDILRGGPGSDLYFVRTEGDRALESRTHEGTDTVISFVNFRMGRSHIEDLELSDQTILAIVGAGNGLANRITGNRQDNTLDGGKNNDTLIGGEGNDTYLIRAPGDTARESFNEGIDTVKAYRSYALEAHIERLFMQTVRTKDGNPTEFNGIGNGLDNTIVGTPFANTIIGREGSDILRGQAGADTFVFDRALGANNVDRIVDFNRNEMGEGDILKMKSSIFGGLSVGQLDASAFTVGSAASDADDRFVYDDATRQLFFDADGSGAAAQQLVLTLDQGFVTADDIVIF